MCSCLNAHHCSVLLSACSHLAKVHLHLNLSPSPSRLDPSSSSFHQSSPSPRQDKDGGITPNTRPTMENHPNHSPHHATATSLLFPLWEALVWQQSGRMWATRVMLLHH